MARDSVRLGAVGFLNARPLTYGLDGSPRFDLRYDVPSECARLLHAGAIDVGLIPSIEYLRGGPYRIVPDVAVASDGPVASVALYVTKPIDAVRSIAMDTNSRTSVALVEVLCAKHFHIHPSLEPHGPDLPAMLACCDAALIIGDVALTLDYRKLEVAKEKLEVKKVDLGESWKEMTGLPFVYAFWAGPPDALAPNDVERLQAARQQGETQPAQIAREYFADSPALQPLGAAYLRDNIKYRLGDRERAGLEAFYRYAAEVGTVSVVRELDFFR